MQTPEQNNPRSPEVKTAKEPRVSHLQGCLGICFMLSYWPRAEDWVRGLPATVAPTTCPEFGGLLPTTEGRILSSVADGLRNPGMISARE